MTAERVERFNASYVDGRPPWDIGRPQPAITRLAAEGQITGSVVDVGCGTGENVLHLASLGCEVTGFDFAPAAIAQARRKAAERRLDATFIVADVLDLGTYESRFDSAIDSGCFHVFDDEDRRHYTASVRGALRTGGTLFLVCFSERQPGDWGPRRVTQAELRAAFAEGWRVNWIRAAHFEVGPQIREIIGGEGPESPPRIEAWLMAATRI